MPTVADCGFVFRSAKAGRLARSWIFRFKGRYMGLGSVTTIGLAQAQERAREARELLLDGHDPIEARRAQRALQRVGGIRFALSSPRRKII